MHALGLPAQSRLRALLVLIVAAGCCLPAAAQVASTPPPEVEDPLDAGFWPTPRMLDGALRRVAIQTADRYDLTPQQQEQVEEHLLERWKSFFAANRADLQPLINEFVEARLAPKPPNPDQVAAWAARARPVFQRLRENIEAGEQEVRAVLNPQQQAQFDASRFKRHIGLRAFESKLKRWSVGDFEPKEWWKPPVPPRQPAEEAAAKSAPSSPAPRPAGATPRPKPVVEDLHPRLKKELAAWVKYVRDFCNQYHLDRSQRNTAESILREMLARAEDHAKLYRERIAALEQRRANPAPDDTPEAFNRELEALYGPLDQMFAELKSRLGRLPTSGQRRQAEQQAP
jgi:hypothetical protein